VNHNFFNQVFIPNELQSPLQSRPLRDQKSFNNLDVFHVRSVLNNIVVENLELKRLYAIILLFPKVSSASEVELLKPSAECDHCSTVREWSVSHDGRSYPGLKPDSVHALGSSSLCSATEQ
jgi:hypothetical protein